MKKLLLAAAAICAAPLIAFAAVQAPAVDTARLAADIKTLSSDAFEGRAPPAPARKRPSPSWSPSWRRSGWSPAAT